jgi:hypothetical protein
MTFAQFGIGVAQTYSRLMFVALSTWLLLSAMPALAQTNKAAFTNHSIEFANSPAGQFHGQTNQSLSIAQRVGKIRWECIEKRRIICGKILKVLPEGLVVHSGYTNLMRPPLNASWLVPGAVRARPAANLVEGNEADSVCIGLVFLTDLPKKPVAKVYDYVNLEGFPTGQYTYTSVGNVQRTVRRFSAKLDKAVQWKSDESQRQNAPLK